MDENNTNSRNERLAVVALVCGVTSIFIFPLAFGGAAIVFGIMVQDRASKESRAYQNARLGIVFGIIGIVFWIVTLATMNLIGFDPNSMLGLAPQEQSAF